MAKAKVQSKPKTAKNATAAFTLEKRPDGVAMVWMDMPGSEINTLSVKTAENFREILSDIGGDPAVKAAVWISRKPDCFLAGADIEEFKTFGSAEETARIAKMGQDLFNLVADNKKPQVAAINGVALGGGLEFSLACHYRIITTHKTSYLGAPEVKLGLIPAAGGTQRLPRLIGLQSALDMLLTGKNVYPRNAKKLGLVDEVVSPWALADKAASAALRLVKNGLPERKGHGLQDRVMKNVGPVRDFILKKAREMVLKQTKGNYPAPLKILDSVRVGLESGLNAGLAAESSAFGDLIATPQSRELVSLFFAMTAKKKHPLAEGAPETKNVGVLGAGLMGAGIALVTAQEAQTPAILKDITPEFLAGGEKYIHKSLAGRAKKGAISNLDLSRILARVYPATDYAALARADLVVEAVFEDLDLKRKVLAEVERVAGKDCVFASNTSSLPIAEIAKGSKRPENVLGMHYFSPVEKMPLLEIIRTDKTSDYALAKAVAFGVKQGKTVIVVRDGPGFYTTRILAPYLNETCLLLEEGARIEEIDGAMKRFGYPVGPVVLLDEVGIGVAAHVSGFLGKVNLERRPGLRISGGIPKMFEAGYQGRKNKKGFYLYEAKKSALPAFLAPKKPKMPNEAVYEFFGGAPRKTMKAEDIAERLGLVMVNEAALCLEEGIIESPTDGDLGAILGLGFPPFRGGPFRYVDEAGVETVVVKLQALAEAHGPQFAPAQILVDHAKARRKFHRK